MAARISFLFALGAPLCRAGPYTPPDIDFSKVEFWPLSGGVADGVTVDFSAAGLKDGESAIIDFVTAEYDVAFRWHMDKANMQIERKTWENDDWVTADIRGGWPIQDTNAPFKLGFTKTLNHWAISVDGKRMPWFDFQHSAAFDGKDVVYAAVHIGFMDGEVVDKRSACTTPCNAEECVGSFGGSTCSEATCYSRIPVKMNNTYTVSCSGSTTTPAEGESCCDGGQLNYIDADAGLVNSWVRVFTDAEMVKTAASAFGSTSAPAFIEPAAGNKVEIRGFDAGTELYTVWVPQLYTGSRPVADQQIQLPGDVLAMSELNGCILPAGSASGAQLAPTNALIYSAGGSALPQWWFLNMWDLGVDDETYKGDGTNWWISYSDENIANFDIRGKSYWVVDEDMGHPSCTDEAAWQDKQGANCQTYTDNVWCADHGVATPAFVAAKDTIVFDGDKLWRPDVATGPTSQWSAIQMCCLCGGGYHGPPTVTATCPGSELFQ